MGDYASKGVAGTGLGFGIAGTALGLLNGNGCNGGILGNLLGGNCNGRMGAELQYISDLQAKVGRLEAEKYSDQNDKAVYQQTLADNRNLRDELYAFIKPLADEAANNRVKIAQLEADQKCCCEKQELQAQITAGKINETTLALNGKIDTMQANYNGAFNSLNQTIACIQNTVNEVTSVCLNSCKMNPPVVYATQGVPASGATWYTGCCVQPITPATTTTTPAA